MWAQMLNAALGVWLMAAPAVLGYGPPAETNDRIVGPVIATFAIVACWEATRPVRRWNLPLGAWLLLAPWVLGYAGGLATLNSLAVGVLVIGLARVRGTITGRYGGGWSALWRSDTLHARAAADREKESGNAGASNRQA